MQNRICTTVTMRIHGRLVLIVLIVLMDMMLIQQNSILEMTQISKDSFIQWKTSGENQIEISVSKQISRSVHFPMSKMSARNSLIRLKRSDTGWIIEKTLM